MQKNNQPDDTRTKRQNRLGIILLFAIAIWIAFRILETPLLPEGSEAPGWKLPLADGSKRLLGLDDMATKVVVVEFLSLGCPHCVRQQKVLSELMRKKASSGVVVVGILCGGEELSDVEEYYKQTRVDFPVVVDPGASAVAYKVSSFPTLYVIDCQGKIVDAERGFWKLEGVLGAVEKALGQQ